MNKENINIAFVILHYLTIDETMQCVKYIKKNIDTEEYHIVIVDNCSSNNTGKLLQERYGDDKNVSVIINEVNEGYARGLNRGILYIKARYVVQYVVLMNNDIYLLEKAFYQKVQLEYMKSRFTAMGPMILSKDGRCDTNPYRKKMPSRNEVERAVERCKRIQKNDAEYKYRWFVLREQILGFIYRKVKRKYPQVEEKNFWEHQEDILIHGSIMILSPIFFDYFDKLDSNTFMYAEEYVLYLHLKDNDLKEVYCPDIQVMHAGSSSVGIVAKKEAFDKRYYYSKHAADSLAYVLEMMEKD